jgi:two-component system alkaline phosphatase synthesis response regulator PhoP
LIYILIIAKETEIIKELTARLISSGLNCSVAVGIEQALKQAKDRSPDLILADIDNTVNIHQTMDIHSRIGMTKNPLVMVLIQQIMLNDIANNSGIADFIIKPCSINEFSVRVQRLIKRIKNINSKKIISCGDLIIDTVSCEVHLGGRLVELTFKEYELLRFLAASKGRVFTREALLNKVWKYDYLGGERTVDVHIRRLRSKIEGVDHSFIETVRNIGYRFRKDT